ncbi:MAG: glycosyltransferase [Bacteroidetes bacterium]|nr:glycosyltransferase [Bacteroidota bacterium]
MKAYGAKWHSTFSPSIRDFLIEPLKEWLTVDFIPWDASDDFPVEMNDPAIYCQFLPPPKILLDNNRKATWIPMWDSVYMRKPEWWAQIPGHIRVVAFSGQVETMARQSGHVVLRLKFFKDPGLFVPADWSKPMCLFYWNRTNLVSTAFLKKMCKALSVKKLILINRPDPGFSAFNTREIEFLNRQVRVDCISDFLDTSTLFSLLSSAHFYLAPRRYEGIGMAFIEAMCSGLCVLAANEATMNEYIEDQQNGILLNSEAFHPALNRRIVNKWRRLVDLPVFDLPENLPSLTYNQPWNDLKNIDFQIIGRNAVQSMKAGYNTWKEQKKEFYEFLTNW